MKIVKIKSLVYKEFYMARKPMIIGMFNFLIFALMGILIEASFQSGNLALLSDAVKGDIKEMADLGIILYPVIMVCFIVTFIAEASLKDEASAWKRFCHTTPASPVDFAIAKYAAFLITILAESLFSFLYAAFICHIIGVAFSALYAAYIWAMVVLTTLMAVLNHLGVLLFHTKDKAGLFMFGVLFGMILMLVFINMNAGNTEFTTKVIDNILIGLLHWMPVMTAMILVVGCVLSAMLLKRREA